MKFSASFHVPSSSSSLRLLTPVTSAMGTAELPGVTAIRKKLVLTALERPVRFRTDLDLLVIQQYLASLEAFANVTLPALHYLSTEATLLIDGSLCGYFNKAFSHRPNTKESFQVWNARQVRKHGVLIDFGEFQSTYSNGALCGFDDLVQARPQKAKSKLDTLSRCKGIDTLERMRQRFSLSYEKDALSVKETSQSELSYLGICSQLSEFAKSKLLQSAPRRHLSAGEELSLVSEDTLSTSDGQIDALMIVLYGRLDVFWDGDEDAFAQFNALGTDENTVNSYKQMNLSEELTPAAIAATERLRLEELTQLQKTPLATIRRGQTFGDQSLGLALDKLYPGAQLTTTSVPIRLTSGDAVTELIWISRALYEEHLREDRVRLSYHPLSSAASSSLSVASPKFSGEFRDWAMHFFSKKDIVEREASELGELSRRMLADAKMSKLIFQFPPLVLERVCHAMELRHFNTDGLFLGIGDEISSIAIVVHGALRMLAPTPATSVVSPANKSPMLRTASAFQPRSTATVVASIAAKPNTMSDSIEQFLPGDVFGVSELLNRSLTTTSSRVVYVQADTLLLNVPRTVFERWLAPLHVDTIFNAGSSFQRLVAPGSVVGNGRSQYIADKKDSKLTLGPARRQSMMLKPSATNGSPAPLGAMNLLTGQEEPSSDSLPVVDDATLLLKKMGIFPLIPRFLLSEMLLKTSVVHKAVGDVLFHEGEESQYLVVLLTGFLSFYSLEHMSTTLEMFQKHSFCHFSSFEGSQTNPEDFVADEVLEETGGDTHTGVAIAKHRAAMHGVHIQTLHAHNTFRTGVLLDGTICPATVVAQTNCECLVLEESVYMNLLKSHRPVVDLGKAEFSHLGAVLSASSNGNDDQDDDDNDSNEVPPPGSLRSILSQRNPSTLSSAVVKCLERTQLPWLTRSPLKMQQLLHGMRCVSVLPGERLVRCNDVLDHLFIVLSGKLSLFIRQNEDVSTFLDASQRSVRSLMLERSVMSNYSTTSQQLYKEAHGGGSSGSGAVSPSSGKFRGRIGSRQDAFAKRKIIRNKISRISESGLFIDSVLAAVREMKPQKRARGGTVIDIPEHQQLSSNTTNAVIMPIVPEPPSSPLRHDRNRSTASILIHSAAAKAKLQQKIETRRATRTSLDGGLSGSLFLCNLGPGEVFGDEILAPHGTFRSSHDMFVDVNTAPAPASGAGISSSVAANSGGAQLILLDRQLFHSINSKSDAELEKELRVRSKLAKSKWHKIERTITRKLSQTSIPAGGGDTNTGTGGKGASKLFDLFKNILNQRCLLTMRTIADIPLLRDLSDASKREICLAARFEALERGMNAYKENGAHSSGPRYYFLLSGRIGLYGKNLNGTFFSYSNSSTNNSSSTSAFGSTTTTTTATESCLREVLAGDGFGEFELLVPEFSRCISALALESSCRLLSFPAAAFLKHWPHTAQMKSDIEYLRTRVPFFSRLELEKIAYLYTTLSFQTFTRGSNIFEQGHATTSQFSTAGELYLIKEGTCAIRQRVVLDAQRQQLSDGESAADLILKQSKQQQKLPTHRLHQPEKHLFRVIVTVADVSDGHLFWIDGGVGSSFPFTLQAVSASVTITNVAIDKLRAILPRTQLAALEKASNQMAVLYKKQFDMAKKAVVTLMNEKRAAQMGMTTNPTFLPVLNFQSPQKVSPSPPVVSSSTVGSANSSIPFSRLLMTRPVDLVALQHHERETAKLFTQPTEPLESDSTNSVARYWRGGGSISAVDAVYQNQHLSEHYQLEHGLPNSTLVGSFPDDFSLRRRRRSSHSITEIATKETSAAVPISTALSFQEPQSLDASSISEKVNERMEPESVPISNTKVAEDAAVQTKQLNDSASHICLEVKVPIFHDPYQVLNPRVPTPPSNSRPRNRGGAFSASVTQAVNMTPRSPRFSPGFQKIGGGSENGYDDDDRFCDFEVDLRALLRAEMKDIDAPMRTIKLEPSLSKVNALGQYLTLYSPPSPGSSASSWSAQLRHAPPCLSNNLESPKPKLKSSTPFKIFPQAKAHVKQTPVTSFATAQGEPNQDTLQCHKQALVRKQGFLCVVTALDPQISLISVLPRVMQHRRRFFSLVDNFLVEYAANVAIQKLETAQSLSRYHLDDEQSGVIDVPVIPGEAQATLQLSFELIVDRKTRLILTAESAAEKRKWMKELSQACVLGPRSTPMHQQILQPQDTMPGLWSEYSSAPSTVHEASQGPGSRVTSPRANAADADAALGFEVEYRIG